MGTLIQQMEVEIMQDAFLQMEMLLGEKETEQIGRARIAVFGVGGLGACITDALARCGVGSLTLMDGKEIQTEDLNHHAFAFRSTVGKPKVEAAKHFVHEIDENILVNTYATACSEETIGLLDFRNFDYVIDTTDSEAIRQLIAGRAREHKIPVLFCTSLSGLRDLHKIEITELWRRQVYGIPPALKHLRTELKGFASGKIKVLYSREKSAQSKGSIVYVAGVAGMRAAAEVIKDLLEKDKKKAEELHRDIK